MNRPFYLVLVVALASLASDLSGSVVPDRQATEPNAPPKNFTNTIGMKFVWIPPGTFTMGSPREEKDRTANETQHKVTLTKGFYMGVYTVTKEQWKAVMGKIPGPAAAFFAARTMPRMRFRLRSSFLSARRRR